MSTLAEIVKNVLVIIIITSFLELMLPEGGLKPFVRFAIGLFIIIAVLNPLLGYLFDERSFEIGWWDAATTFSGQEQITQEGQKLNQQISSLGSQSLQEKVEGQITAMAHLVPGVAEVTTHAELDEKGNLNSLKILVKPEDLDAGQSKNDLDLSDSDKKTRKQAAQLIKDKVKEILVNFYGLQGVQIEIVVEGS